jgi:hypothetical protein
VASAIKKIQRIQFIPWVSPTESPDNSSTVATRFSLPSCCGDRGDRGDRDVEPLRRTEVTEAME